MDRPRLLRIPTDDIERSAERQYQDPESRPPGLDSPGSGSLAGSEDSTQDPLDAFSQALVNDLREALFSTMAPAPIATASKAKEVAPSKAKEVTPPKHLKTRKKKVLLMGKSGSGKSSMRSIIFSNYVAKDVRRLAATIDVEQSRVKFLGNLVLNLWDCGGQDAFTDNFLNAQRKYVFADVGVLIYVFDVESHDFDRDLATYIAVIKALQEYSPRAAVFCLIHKMDLVQVKKREGVYQERSGQIREKSEVFAQSMQTYATSIWDQSLYKAWGSIVHSLVPNLELIESYMRNLADVVEAEELILFERTTFLTVSSYTSKAGSKNPFPDRLERISNIMKAFKNSLAKYSASSTSSTSSHQLADFAEKTISTSQCTIALYRFTTNTYVCLVFPPGEAAANCTRLNVQAARATFSALDPADGKGKDRGDSVSDAGTDPVLDEEASTIDGPSGTKM